MLRPHVLLCNVLAAWAIRVDVAQAPAEEIFSTNNKEVDCTLLHLWTPFLVLVLTIFQRCIYGTLFLSFHYVAARYLQNKTCLSIWRQSSYGKAGKGHINLT